MVMPQTPTAGLRKISLDTVMVVKMFEDKRYVEAAFRAGRVADEAQRWGHWGISQAAAAVRFALRRDTAHRMGAVDLGLTELVVEVERISLALGENESPGSK